MERNIGGHEDAPRRGWRAVSRLVPSRVRYLVWTAWGKSTATASGTAVADLCAYEDCHTGSFTSVHIRLIASKIANCAKNVRAYSTLRYVFVGTSPWEGIPANVKTSGYITGPGRPLPPANQTVSLTCAP